MSPHRLHGFVAPIGATLVVGAGLIWHLLDPGWACGCTSKKDSARALVGYAEAVVVIHTAENGQPPGDLRMLVGEKQIKARQLLDPWNRTLTYHSPSLRGHDLEFDLCSTGPDGIEFTPDDICNE